MTAQPSGPAPSGGGSPGGSPTGSLVMMVAIMVPFIALIFWQNRSQQKKQKELEEKLKKGDRVVTQSGLIGKIVEISPTARLAKLELAPGVKVDILKTSIVGVDAEPAGSAAKGEAAASDKK